MRASAAKASTSTAERSTLRTNPTIRYRICWKEAARAVGWQVFLRGRLTPRKTDDTPSRRASDLAVLPVDPTRCSDQRQVDSPDTVRRQEHTMGGPRAKARRLKACWADTLVHPLSARLLLSGSPLDGLALLQHLSDMHRLALQR